MARWPAAAVVCDPLDGLLHRRDGRKSYSCVVPGKAGHLALFEAGCEQVWQYFRHRDRLVSHQRWRRVSGAVLLAEPWSRGRERPVQRRTWFIRWGYGRWPELGSFRRQGQWYSTG